MSQKNADAALKSSNKKDKKTTVTFFYEEAKPQLGAVNVEECTDDSCSLKQCCGYATPPQGDFRRLCWNREMTFEEYEKTGETLRSLDQSDFPWADA